MEEFNYNKDSSTVTDFEYIILEVMGMVTYNMVVDSLFMHNLLEYLLLDLFHSYFDVLVKVLNS